MRKFVVYMSIFLSIGWFTLPSQSEPVTGTMGRASFSYNDFNNQIHSNVEGWNRELERQRVVQDQIDVAYREGIESADRYIKRLKDEARKRQAQQRVSRSVSVSNVWRALGECESHNNPKAVSSSGKYRGAFQFSIATWHSIGYGGDPIEHSYETQLAAAKKLQARSGWDQWPSCAKRLGLI